MGTGCEIATSPEIPGAKVLPGLRSQLPNLMTVRLQKAGNHGQHAHIVRLQQAPQLVGVEHPAVAWAMGYSADL